jgi:hypothetical protein
LVLEEVPHAFSHLRIRYCPVVLTLGASREGEGPEGRWATWKEMDELPFPVAQRKIAGAVRDALEEGTPERAKDPERARDPA